MPTPPSLSPGLEAAGLEPPRALYCQWGSSSPCLWGHGPSPMGSPALRCSPEHLQPRFFHGEPVRTNKQAAIKTRAN